MTIGLGALGGLGGAHPENMKFALYPTYQPITLRARQKATQYVSVTYLFYIADGRSCRSPFAQNRNRGVA